MQMSVVILAGGKGTRFAPFVTNKTVWPLAGKSALAHTIEMVRGAGIDDILVIGSSVNEPVIRSYQTTTPNLRYRLQDEAKGMDDALQTAKDMISTQPILVLNAIDFLETNLIKSVRDAVERDKPKLLVVGKRTNVHLPLGYYVLENDRVTGVMEKPEPSKEPSDVIRMVCDYFADPQEFISLFDQFKNTETKDRRYELAQDTLLRRYGSDIVYASEWAAIKYPHYVLDVVEYVLAHRIHAHIDESAVISPHAHIEGRVQVDAGAHIDAYAVIKGPAYIGRNVRVGSHTLIRQSMIEEGATIGYGSEVARSYVGPDCMLHHSFVGDSVLEKAVNMSWGTVTTNLRLDQRAVRCKLPDGTYIPTDRVKLGAMIAQGVFLGSNVCTMPGACIAANSIILPGRIVS